MSENITENIILMGYRGTGKTTVATILAQKLQRKILSTDEEIARLVGSISEFVLKQGWEKFREIESKVIADISLKQGIVDCGGGAVEEEKNIAELKKRGLIVWLKATAPVIWERIKNSDRPALTSKSSTDEVEEVLLRREPLYRKAANVEITAENKNPEQVAEEIITILGFKPRLCVPLVAETVEEALHDLREAEQHADLVELRIDYIKNISQQGLRELIAARTKPMITTCRGKQAEKKELLLKAVEFGAEFIDLDGSEKSMIEEVRKMGKTRVILSFHDFSKTPPVEELNQKYEEMAGDHPDFIKIVTTAASINDNFKIFEFLKGKKKCIAFCMGIKGVISRILAPKYGSFLTFASLNEKKTSAPGQLAITEMKKYGVAKINEVTEIYGVIGEAAEHSRSPQIHNTFFQEESENACFLPFKVEEKELKEFISNMREYHFRGAAVTMPHKVAVIQYLDKIDETAAGIGAVNTIVNNRGKLIGYNTDSYGALRALQDKTEVKDKKVLVLGAGGAARAVVHGLQKGEARVTISNRTLEKAQQLAEEFHTDCWSLAEAEKRASEYDIIINATSVGMGLLEVETPLRNVPQEKIVMDIIPHQSITTFIKLAQQNKCTVITGEKMLLYQAVQQQHLWRGKELNSEVLEHVRQLLR